MTGFSRISGAWEEFTWLWELKSVNGRGLEIRCRLPGGLDRVEEVARKKMKHMFQRGTINIHLQLQRSGSKTEYQINEIFLKQLIECAKAQENAEHLQPASIDGLLNVRGVVEQAEQSRLNEEDQEVFEAELLNSFEQALEALKEARDHEGVQLTPVLKEQVETIQNLISEAEKSAALRPEAVKERINRQMEILLASKQELDEGRIEQELALIATKADISEELDRLKGHVTSCLEILNRGHKDGIGRRLDFMCQEFNREANTLCSKSNDKSLTQVGLDMKVIIDRLREQVQNIE
ncbi:YicC family protein [Sneathiella sp. P13V-1]|nr:YicC family protein [Sneathiella sp. P13V-1]